MNKFYNIEDILYDYDYVDFKKYQILNVASCFDIETSSMYIDGAKIATMYCWAFSFDEYTVRGRTWDEFIKVINILVNHYKTSIVKRLVIYVHNLSYEFQWFRKYFKWFKVFCIKNRTPIYAITEDGIEFRCSYLLTGYKLETLANNVRYKKIKKLQDKMNYDLVRHKNTKLTEDEWEYVRNDTLIVVYFIKQEIIRLGSLSKIPYTLTGYVRLYLKDNAFNPEYKFSTKKLMGRLILTPDTYSILRKVYSGGFTHSNAKHTGKIIKNVHSYDFTSSYIYSFLSEKYPMSSPIKMDIDTERFYDYINRYCCFFKVTFKYLEPKFNDDFYISYHKCTSVEHYVLDNGRVVRASKLSIWVNEIDFKIIKDNYKWEELYVYDFYIMQKDYLPKYFVETLLTLYKNKTELKGIPEYEVEYSNSKSMLNSTYGMCVTDICRNIFEYRDSWTSSKSDIPITIDYYNNDKNRYLFYAWGIWDSAYSRYNLWTGIFEFKSDYLYSDTDSLKVINIDRHMDYINRYNENTIVKYKDCLKHNNIRYKVFVNNKNEPSYLGQWCYEGKYKYFKTLGAKRYMYCDDDDNLQITIAGVSKTYGRDYLLNTYKTIKEVFKNFDEDLVFPAYYTYNGEKILGCGKLTHTYVDESFETDITDYRGNTCTCKEESYVHLEPSSYCMSITDDFKTFIYSIQNIKED